MHPPLYCAHADVATVLAPRYASTAEVGLINPLEAVFGPMFVFLAVGEAPSRWTLIGGALLIVSLVGHELWGCRYAKPGHAATEVKCESLSVTKRSHLNPLKSQHISAPASSSSSRVPSTCTTTSGRCESSV